MRQPVARREVDGAAQRRERLGVQPLVDQREPEQVVRLGAQRVGLPREPGQPGGVVVPALGKNGADGRQRVRRRRGLERHG